MVLLLLLLKNGLGLCFSGLLLTTYCLLLTAYYLDAAGAGCGLTILPIAHTNPASSRASAAAATGAFFRAWPVRCLYL